MKRVLSLILMIGIGSFTLRGQVTFPRNDVKDERSRAFIFKNATIIVDHQHTIKNGMLMIKDGKIQNVAQTLNVPEGYTVIDLEGKFVYPGLIDIYTSYGLPAVKKIQNNFWGREQIQSATKGAYNANQAIKPEYAAAEEFAMNSEKAKKLRNLGFGSVLSFRADGIARGSSVFATLGNDSENVSMLNTAVAAHYSFNKGSSTQSYPVSAMGYIALLRQTYLDAEWYKSLKTKPFTDQSLVAWNQLQSLPQIFETNNWLQLLRADRVGDEFGKQYIIKGGGDEYKRIQEVKATGASLIIPLNFPEAFDVEDPLDAMKLSLKQMLHWELAPTNPGILEKNGIEFAITTHRVESGKFWKNLRKAIGHGLSEETALKALTTIPARLINMDDMVGSLKTGMVANFLVTSGNLFSKDVVIYENWIQGKRYVINPMDQLELAGKYDLNFMGNSYNLEISGKPGKHSAKIIINDTTSVKVKMKVQRELVTLNFDIGDKEISDKEIRFSGWVDGKDIQGRGQLGNGDWVSWQALHRDDLSEEDKADPVADKADSDYGKVLYPYLGYGNAQVPTQKSLLFKNATVWTNESDGIMQNTDVLVKQGKIVKIGKNISDKAAEVIDATGKHLTSGIIDEHTHIAATSINDVATNSSMVRIGDVINPDDINIYRQLSGGVTAAQILHGSANPIGGQSALIKFRWGASPEAMKIKGADNYIKFALGENVKRSRSTASRRYPQTRMGVEQVYMDAFTNALEYEKEWKSYNKLSTRQKATADKPRRDLVHEAMLEIIRGQRFISCHSYVQSEINMLMHVADHFGFKVNTFTHILEGYKVADKMAAHGVGGSTFADWWAYKWEVRYAIPYNPILMQMAGVTVAINSDDAEMARRLNQEAAKSVKYGGMSEEDAWKMVTLNPAKLLHLDDRMGSIKVGKDADLVLWIDNPLSIYAKAEKTMVDGIIYYDMQEDLKKRKFIQHERARLVHKMKEAKKGGASTQKPFETSHVEFHCDVIVGDHVLYLGEH
ncbi:amidohydrolase family protein [Fulvivirgaceae bacterium BMA12]|uniref:Amidohydrolase family protein n=1 Tax=Agaribacillus aureus TaxID=3051825 RepID=A0ABT8L7U8_9BACT|nr:amidohydrolase family protein [Fulvivirgaceae bacterium BMA12]